MRERKPPSYRHYKRRDLAMVRLPNGNNKYLGKFGSPESRRAYREFLDEWEAGAYDDAAPATADAGQTINDLCDEFTRRRVRPYYVRDGRPTSEQENFRCALRPLRDLYGSTVATRFGGTQLERVQAEFVRRGQCRNVVNRNIGRLRALFRWAAHRKLYPVAKLGELALVEPIRKGRGARETRKVRSVDPAVVHATLPELSERVRAIVRLIALTACRPGEMCGIRPMDLDRADPAVWSWELEAHKNAHHDKERTILFGPKAQAILLPYLNGDPTKPCFCPADSVVGDWTGSRRPKPGRPYAVAVLRKAIHKACDRLHPHPTLGNPKRAKNEADAAELKAWRKRWRWQPNQLRHAAATALRRGYGLDVAQAILGHANSRTTEGYTDPDLSGSKAVIREIG